MIGFNDFVEKLAITKISETVFNQYSYAEELNILRRNNLKRYLEQMSNLMPKVLLIGEAPGYKGCRLTGIPFTSEYIVKNGVESLELFGIKRGYEITKEYGIIQKEQSATIVWNILTEMKFYPLLWNAFPFHPFQSDNDKSNRKPTIEELLIGKTFLQDIMEMFPIGKIIAVGNVAEKSLLKMNLNCTKIRHPSFGGKKDFIKGIKKCAG